MPNPTHRYDLALYKMNKKTFHDTFDLNDIKADEGVRFINDVKGQVAFLEKGNNIVITAYDTQEVTYNKVVTEKVSDIPDKKGRYECVIKTYRAVYDNGIVTGFEDEPVKESKAYLKADKTGTVYQTVNSKNKVISSVVDDVTGESTTVVNPKKIIGTVTYENGISFDKELTLYMDSIETPVDLISYSYTPQKKGNKYTGNWLREVVSSSAKNETFALGVNNELSGADVIRYDMDSNQGRDVVVLSDGGRVEIVFDNADGVNKSYSKKGNNLIMALGKNGAKRGQITFKDYFLLAQDGVSVGGESLKTLLESAGGISVLGNAQSKKSQKLSGTFLNEKFYGGAGNDIIKTGAGTDTVYFSAGKDTLVVDGAGDKTIDLTSGGSGVTTLSFENKDADANIVYTKDGKFEKSGNDLVVSVPEDSSFVRVSDYFGNLENVVTFNGADFVTALGGGYLYQYGNEKKSDTLTSTNYKDYLKGGSKSDTIYLKGNGQDMVYGGGGNDTVYVASDITSGLQKNISLKKGDGNDTVILQQTSTGRVTSAKIVLTFDNLEDKKSSAVIKNGNDLIIRTDYEDEVVVGKKTKTVKTSDSITVKDYFYKSSSGTLSERSNMYFQSATATLNTAMNKKTFSDHIDIVGVKSGKTTVFEGSRYADVMTYSGNSATMSGGRGNDVYNITFGKKSDIVVSDTEDSNKVNIFDKYENLRILFNVDKQGQIVAEEGKGESLWIFNKDAFDYKNVGVNKANLGKISVKNYFLSTNSSRFTFMTQSDGVTLDMVTYIDKIKSDVANWFTNDYKGTCETVWDVLSDGNTADIKSLINVFNTEYPLAG